ncbi:UvrABC system protein C [Bacteroidia bacterium]|nr:UvrABC system protein C [Bacteroidia bacterium]
MFANETLQLLVKSLPDTPGVYQYFDADGVLLYIGKAKNLKKRVSSYFTKEQEGKTYILVKKIADIKHIVVDSEFDALLLENNLIKKYRPRYNVLLKDDKTYPWICITNESFPRIFSTRRRIKDGSQYFGPYPMVRTINTLLELLRKLYPLRSCRLNLSSEAIARKKYRVCLEYHIKNCAGPCCALQSETDYLRNIQQIRNILRGHTKEVLCQINAQMMLYAQTMEFEKAQIEKKKLEMLENYRAKSTIFSNTLTDVDVFSIVQEESIFYVNYLKVVDGAVNQVQTIEMIPQIHETMEDVLLIAIVEIRERYQSHAKETVVQMELSFTIPQTTFIVPQKGDRKALLELSMRNLKYYILEKNKHKNLVAPDQYGQRLLAQIQKDLVLDALPRHIECFDNSNIQGDYAVAAMSVAKNGKLSKKDYRHFNIKTVEGIDDFASMEEVIYRRYARLLEENQSLPQLIIVDGGKGQLSAAMNSLKKLKITDKIHIIGIAKNLEELYRPGDPYPLHLDKKSETLQLIQRLRDEVHRFGITHYRQKHQKGLIRTELTDIKGIGDGIAAKLLKRFKSVKNIKATPLEELSECIGAAKAQLVHDYFN